MRWVAAVTTAAAGSWVIGREYFDVEIFDN
jgi:hypothetical protein